MERSLSLRRPDLPGAAVVLLVAYHPRGDGVVGRLGVFALGE